ncbi:MAG: hypothetical protein PHY12_00850 [Eubacteriales bacterium]|nr:hypothetical protein [Eubacteriales bacterium]
MKKMLAEMLALMMALMMALSVCACSFAEGSTVTLAELKAQAPERLQMTVTTEAGETVTVDAPVILPDADVLPVLLCRNQLFIFAEDDQHHVLYSKKESSQNLLYGKTDTTGRYPLLMGEKPPENDFTLEQAVELIMRNNAELGGDTNVDLRPNRVAAMSGLCKMKSTKVTNEATGVSFRAPMANPKYPVKGKEKGLWCIKMSQYLRGVRVIDDSERRYLTDGYWSPSPTKNESYVMDDENFKVLIGYLREERTLTNDYPLASWDAVENSLRTLIQENKLKSVYLVELVYLVKALLADHEAIQRSEWTKDAFSCDYALVPVWEIKGWNLYEQNVKYFANDTSPDRETILMNGIGESFPQEDYVLRLNADTATPFEPKDKVYDGEVNEQ